MFSFYSRSKRELHVVRRGCFPTTWGRFVVLQMAKKGRPVKGAKGMKTLNKLGVPAIAP